MTMSTKLFTFQINKLFIDKMDGENRTSPHYAYHNETNRLFIAPYHKETNFMDDNEYQIIYCSLSQRDQPFALILYSMIVPNVSCFMLVLL
uniref:Uncharacterized protein n=1 Tax=Aegilops tauschii subsp. strangulata TaxID=200361 RepID=A0A453LF02_AEGTS